ncbi:unnamed protein product [Prorocentrum cordatum]|uniref:Uncharacterized protein n=1 Tax=Prorocentrum cordatum TaxID=2364126 RepID=A0ABN9TNI0_9DINO|nr:unnamed protein product [Polarella glacialis]
MAPKGFADPNRVQRMQLPPARRRFRKLFRDLIVAKFGARVLARRATANILQHVERKAVGALNVGEDLRGGYFVAAAAALVAARQEEHRQRRRAHPPPPADAKTRQWASEASKGAGRAPSPAGAAAMAFSAPMDGPGLSIDASLSFDTAAPTGELLRLKPLLRCSLLCLLVNAVVMLIVDYVPAAVVDILTVMYGYMLLRRDMQGLAQGLPAFTLIAGLDCALQVITLMQVLTVAPGARYFLADACPLDVTQADPRDDLEHDPGHIEGGGKAAAAEAGAGTHGKEQQAGGPAAGPKVKDGQTIHKQIDPCSWHTVTGNLALVISVVLEFICMRLSFKMFKAMREAASSSLLSLLDVEGGGRLQDPVAAAAASGPGAEGPRSLLDRRGPAQGGAQGALRGQGAREAGGGRRGAHRLTPPSRPCRRGAALRTLAAVMERRWLSRRFARGVAPRHVRRESCQQLHGGRALRASQGAVRWSASRPWLHAVPGPGAQAHGLSRRRGSLS